MYDVIQQDIDNLMHSCLVSEWDDRGHSWQRLDPLLFMSKSKKWIENSCKAGGKWGVTESSERNCVTACSKAVKVLIRHDYKTAGEKLLLDFWDFLQFIQSSEEAQHINRYVLARTLSKLYIQMKDYGAAIRWEVLAQAERMLHGQEPDLEILQATLNIDEETCSNLLKIAEENVHTVETDPQKNWSSIEGFPEDILFKWGLQNRELAYLLAQTKSVHEYRPAVGYFRALLRKVNDKSLNTSDQGKALEKLAAYLFFLVPGWIPLMNAETEDQTFETDVIVRNFQQASNLTADLLGRHFLVECKNWNRTVGVSEIGYFLYRMHLTHAKFGVVFAKNGITGDKSLSEEKASRSLIRRAFHEDHIVCVVLDEEKLHDLESKGVSFWSMLLKEIEIVQFGVPRDYNHR